MQQVNGKNLCEYCFSDMQESDQFCSSCGLGKENYSVDPGSLAVGEILAGKYLIGKTLGRGGFGITYLGFDIPGNRKVAIKEYLPDAGGETAGTEYADSIQRGEGKSVPERCGEIL